MLFNNTHFSIRMGGGNLTEENVTKNRFGGFPPQKILLPIVIILVIVLIQFYCCCKDELEVLLLCRVWFMGNNGQGTPDWKSATALCTKLLQALPLGLF